MKGSVLCICFFFLVPFIGFSQDLHFSQYDKAQTNLNPALTGVFSGDLRFSGNYKSQWYAVPVNFQTFAGVAETKFIDRNHPNGYFSGGIRFFYDQAGDSRLSTTDVALTGSYTRAFGPKHLLTFGAGMGFIQRAFRTDDLRFESQWNGNQVDPSLTTQEVFDNTNRVFGNLSAGLNYHFQIPKKRISIDAGVGLFHLNTPDESFRDDADRELPSRASLYAMGSFKLKENVDVGLSAMHQSQGVYRETLFGVSGTLHISQERLKELAVRLGLSFRAGDAVIPNIMIMYQQFTAGFSYDVNSSDFRISTDQRGGPELSFSYRVTKVDTPEDLKICPIY